MSIFCFIFLIQFCWYRDSPHHLPFLTYQHFIQDILISSHAINSAQASRDFHSMSLSFSGLGLVNDISLSVQWEHNRKNKDCSPQCSCIDLDDEIPTTSNPTQWGESILCAHPTTKKTKARAHQESGKTYVWAIEWQS